MAKKKELTPADKAAAERLYARWMSMPPDERPKQQAMADAWGGDANQSLMSQYLRGRIALNYRAVLFFAQQLGCRPEEIRDDLPEQKLSTSLPTTAAQPVRLDPASIAAVTRVLTKVYGLVGLKLDLTDATDAELFADAYAAYVDMDEEDEADITLTARVINFMNAREARYGAKQRGSDGGDAQEGARRKGAA